MNIREVSFRSEPRNGDGVEFRTDRFYIDLEVNSESSRDAIVRSVLSDHYPNYITHQLDQDESKLSRVRKFPSRYRVHLEGIVWYEQNCGAAQNNQLNPIHHRSEVDHLIAQYMNQKP